MAVVLVLSTATYAIIKQLNIFKADKPAFAMTNSGMIKLYERNQAQKINKTIKKKDFEMTIDDVATDSQSLYLGITYKLDKLKINIDKKEKNYDGYKLYDSLNTEISGTSFNYNRINLKQIQLIPNKDGSDVDAENAKYTDGSYSVRDVAQDYNKNGIKIVYKFALSEISKADDMNKVTDFSKLLQTDDEITINFGKVMLYKSIITSGMSSEDKKIGDLNIDDKISIKLDRKINDKKIIKYKANSKDILDARANNVSLAVDMRFGEQKKQLDKIFSNSQHGCMKTKTCDKLENSSSIEHGIIIIDENDRRYAPIFTIEDVDHNTKNITYAVGSKERTKSYRLAFYENNKIVKKYKLSEK